MTPVTDIAATPLRSTPEETQRLLRIYNWYRFVLSLVLALMYFAQWQGKLVGELYPLLYLVTACSYVGFSSLSLLILGLQRTVPSNAQLFLIITVDIAVLSLLTLASGGLETGLGMLMIVSVAAGSIFFIGNIATLVAALATLAGLGIAIYLSFLIERDARHFIQAGILGILLFATSWVFRTLSERIRRGYHLAEAQSKSIAKLEQINEMIVQRMRTGVIVTDAAQHIRIMNNAATELLGIATGSPTDLPPELIQLITRWQQQHEQPQRPVRVREQGPELQVRFASLEYGNTSDVLIFAEDTSRIAQQAQQMKLASLGRLTASIAHEIRNPLGAISHAAQLIQESPTLDPADRRLTDIIQSHSQRMNGIIENILQLSRRQAAKPARINLSEWIPEFIQQFRAGHAMPNARIDVDIPPFFHITFDPTHLNQVLTNLCANGLRHSPHAHITLHASIDRQSEHPVLDVLDDGSGIQSENQSQLFEPFFTTEISGTGLGLYISRELCEFNQASLDYSRTADQHSRFRIRFSHPDRRIALELANPPEIG
ncbi:MAG TPA: ATP-binding protein [Pseudomonadales bacterium]|jgi:two-component system sensor histidine kinase PilS (NtrC family)